VREISVIEESNNSNTKAQAFLPQIFLFYCIYFQSSLPSCTYFTMSSFLLFFSMAN